MEMESVQLILKQLFPIDNKLFLRQWKIKQKRKNIPSLSTKSLKDRMLPSLKNLNANILQKH